MVGLYISTQPSLYTPRYTLCLLWNILIKTNREKNVYALITQNRALFKAVINPASLQARDKCL